jgi:hypothetical protein
LAEKGWISAADPLPEGWEEFDKASDVEGGANIQSIVT